MSARIPGSITLCEKLKIASEDRPSSPGSVMAGIFTTCVVQGLAVLCRCPVVSPLQ